MAKLSKVLVGLLLLFMALPTLAGAEPPFDPPSWCENRWGTDYVNRQACVDRLSNLTVEQLVYPFCELRYPKQIDLCMEAQVGAYHGVKTYWDDFAHPNEEHRKNRIARTMAAILDRCVGRAPEYGGVYDYGAMVDCILKHMDAARVLGQIK